MAVHRPGRRRDERTKGRATTGANFWGDHRRRSQERVERGMFQPGLSLADRPMTEQWRHRLRRSQVFGESPAKKVPAKERSGHRDSRDTGVPQTEPGGGIGIVGGRG